MPIGGGNHGFPRTENISQRAGCHLCFVEIRREINIGCTDELFQILEGYETVVENDVFLHASIRDETFEAQAIAIVLVRQ